MIIAHYLGRGHSLDELANLSRTELLFYGAAWSVEQDRISEILEKIGGETVGK